MIYIYIDREREREKNIICIYIYIERERDAYTYYRALACIPQGSTCSAKNSHRLAVETSGTSDGRTAAGYSSKGGAVGAGCSGRG